jgi:hypothetical protein
MFNSGTFASFAFFYDIDEKEVRRDHRRDRGER